MSIEINNINKHFGQFHALDNINLDIKSGELVALLGPSGCGKTTLLRIIAGLEAQDTGSIKFSGKDTTDAHVSERGVGFVFQHYALFRHMSVLDNVSFGMRMKPKKQRLPKEQINKKAMELLKLVQLDWIADKYPAQLSGGQRQRVALARALAVEPKVLLLDEPFGALDAKVRKELRRWLRRLHDELHITSIFVTHDQEEALEVADRVVVMNHGKIEQIGSPQEVWENPASPFVYGFLGDVNQFKGKAHSGQMQINQLNGWNISAPEHQNAMNAEALAFVRPSDLSIHPANNVTKENGLIGKIDRALVVGPIARIEITPDSDKTQIIEVHLSAQEWQELNLKQEDKVTISPRKARIFLKPKMQSNPDPAAMI